MAWHREIRQAATQDSHLDRCVHQALQQLSRCGHQHIVRTTQQSSPTPVCVRSHSSHVSVDVGQIMSKEANNVSRLTRSHAERGTTTVSKQRPTCCCRHPDVHAASLPHCSWHPPHHPCPSSCASPFPSWLPSCSPASPQLLRLRSTAASRRKCERVVRTRSQRQTEALL